MPGPTTAILSTFSGGDENPLVTDWTCPYFSGEGDLKILGGVDRAAIAYVDWAQRRGK